MTTAHYTPQEQAELLSIAWNALTAAAEEREPVQLDLARMPAALREVRACFVTIHTAAGHLRGCTGTLSARNPLAEEVRYTARQTALMDPRFSPLRPEELHGLQVEISILTPPLVLVYDSPQELIERLRPHVDGVLMMLDQNRATFLPDVWKRAPEPVDFLNLLCHKMGLPPFCWRQEGVQIFTYQTIVIKR